MVFEVKHQHRGKNYNIVKLNNLSDNRKNKHVKLQLESRNKADNSINNSCFSFVFFVV